jgi:hypothetical protein
MPTALSLHIGLNEVDPRHYGGRYPLRGCHNDAHDMAAIARARGYETTVLLDADATASRILEGMRAAAAELAAGDAFLLTYAGHGAQVPDETSDEPDAKDETWVLFDRMLLDDEIYAVLATFRQGVRVLIVSDSCHSGSVARRQEYLASLREGPLSAIHADTTPQFRTPDEVDFGSRVWGRFAGEYRRIAREVPRGQRAMVRAAVIQISGCQDEQLSADGPGNGLFTGVLEQVWASAAFSGDYRAFHQAISTKMPLTQEPNYLTFGRDVSDFERMRPFTLATTNTPTNGTSLEETSSMQDQDLATLQADLEHELIRALVEDRPQAAADDESNPALLVTKLRSVVQRRAMTMRSKGVPRDPTAAFLTFGAKVITEEMAKVISVLEFLLHPAEGFVSWYNDTDLYVHVLTFDEKDAVRWVRYEERNVAPKQAVQLTARGNTIHIYTSGNGATYDCVKGKAYLFDGTNVIEKSGP